MSEIFILSACVLAALCGAGVGWVYGERHGRDTQWLDDYFAAIKKLQPRDKYGRFTVPQVSCSSEATRSNLP